MKDADIRMDDTIRYIRQHAGNDLALTVSQFLVGRMRDISAELSLGSRWDIRLPGTTQKRRAMRALLLCQRIFNSELWPTMSGAVSVLTPVNYLGAGWTDTSTGHWIGRSEFEIQEAIRAYTVTSHSLAAVAHAAAQPSRGVPARPYLTVSRDTFDGAEAPTSCYDAVMSWLFKAGLVSMGWMMKFSGVNTVNGLLDAFGNVGASAQGRVTKEQFPNVPLGWIVHICLDTNPNNAAVWRGHWMISHGNGRGAGVNNHLKMLVPQEDHEPVLEESISANLNIPMAQEDHEALVEKKTGANSSFDPDLDLYKQYCAYNNPASAVFLINPLMIPDRGPVV
ncbi:MAG TPA: hypothetical protein VF800_21385 [Telluria sp.]|jgi:hypothetical protein